MNAIGAHAGQPWYRHGLVWMIIAIPLSSVIVGIAMLVVSVRTYDGLVADDYYKRGVQINRVLARDERARVLGLHALLRMDRSGTQVRLAADSEGFAAPPQLTLRLSHSTRPGLDKTLVLNALGAGDYAGAAVSLEQGRWYVELGNEEWRLNDAFTDGAAERRLTPSP